MNGQLNLRDAVNRTITFSSGAKQYKLKDAKSLATLMVRPRGWHLTEAHVQVDGDVISASMFDFGLFFFHNAKNVSKKQFQQRCSAACLSVMSAEAHSRLLACCCVSFSW